MFENTAANVDAVLAVQRQFRAKQQRREASKANKPNIRRLESRRISDDDELQGLRRERYAKANADPSAELPAAAASRGTRRSPVNYAQWKFQRDTLDETKQQGSSCWFSCQQFARRSVQGQLHPYEPFRVFWDCVVLAMTTYSGFVIPYRSVFDSNAHTWYDWCIDALYWLDIVLNFLTGYVTNDGDVSFVRTSVLRHYVLGWFAIDFTSTIPWNSVAILFSSGMRLPHLTILRLVGILRLARTPRLIHRLSALQNWSFHSEYINFTRFTFYCVLMAHLLACFFFLWPTLFEERCSDVNTIAPNSTQPDFSCTPIGSWRDASGLHGEHEVEGGMTKVEQYTVSLYWAVTTVTSIGYGDITPKLHEEVIFVIFCEAFGMAFFALLVDRVTRLSDVMSDTNETKNGLTKFMQQNNLSKDFREKVVAFLNFQATSTSRRSFNDYDERFQMLNPALMAEMRCQIFTPILRKIKLFSEQVPTEFVDALAQQIHCGPFSPRDEIIAPGTFGEALCIVLTGQVVILSSEVKRNLIMSDDPEPMFAIMAALDEKTFVRTQELASEWSAEAVLYCDIAQIDHDSFALALKETWPDGEEIMKQLARQEVYQELRADGLDAKDVLGDKIHATIWVGGIPTRYATESRLKQLLGKYGKIKSATVRVKAERKSWAFVTFESERNAAAVLKDSIKVYGELDDAGHDVVLKTKPAKLEQELNKQHTGALASVLEHHGSTVVELAASKTESGHTNAAMSSGSDDSANEGEISQGAAYLIDELLGSMRLFEGFTQDERLELAPELLPVSFPAGYSVVNQGDGGDAMFIIATGEAYATVQHAHGFEVTTVKQYSPGDYFGESAMLSGQPQIASVLTATPCTCLVIDRPLLEKLSRNSTVAETLARSEARTRHRLARSKSTRAISRNPSGISLGGMGGMPMLRSGDGAWPRAMGRSGDYGRAEDGTASGPRDAASTNPRNTRTQMRLSGLPRDKEQVVAPLDVPSTTPAQRWRWAGTAVRHGPSSLAATPAQLAEVEARVSDRLEELSGKLAAMGDKMETRFDRLEAALLKLPS